MSETEDEPPPRMLLVARTEAAAENIQLLELQDPQGGDLPAVTPGAHVSVRVPNGALRNYSIASDPADRQRYLIAVKREQGGRGGSVSLIDRVRAGDLLAVSAPRNLFELVDAPSYIFVAGGIGITPILSMIRALRRGDRPFSLFYLTRNRPGTAFVTELSDPGLRGRVTLHHDEGEPARAFDLWPVFETPTKAHIYCCGPRPLMEAVRDMSGHWPASAVHFEDFGSDLVRPRADDREFSVLLARDGSRLTVPVGTSIMEVLRAHGRRVPSSCESGTCGTCRTPLLEGEVDHRDLVLTPAERDKAVMICVSRAKSAELVLDL